MGNAVGPCCLVEKPKIATGWQLALCRPPSSQGRPLHNLPLCNCSLGSTSCALCNSIQVWPMTTVGLLGGRRNSELAGDLSSTTSTPPHPSPPPWLWYPLRCRYWTTPCLWPTVGGVYRRLAAGVTTGEKKTEVVTGDTIGVATEGNQHERTTRAN